MNFVQLLTTATVLARLTGAEVALDDAVREERYRGRDEAQFRAVKGLDGERGRLDVLRRCALRRAIGQPGDDPALEARAEAFRRDDFLGRWAARGYDLPIATPAGEAVRAELERSLPDLPERWRLSHIFLAAATEEERSAAVERLAALCPTLRTLEEFGRQARSISQSESARRNGRLGVVKPGFLRPEAEVVIRALPLGQVSAPVVTGPGVHLFWVEEHFPAGRGLTDKDVERELARRRAAAVADNRRQALARAPRAELGQPASDGLPAYLRIGETTMPGELVRAVVASADPPELLSAWIESERLWHLARLERRLSLEEQRRGDDVAADLRLRSRIERAAESRIVDPTEEEIAARFSANPARYRRPEQMAVRFLRLAIPRDRDPFAEERRLEAEIVASRETGGGLEAVAAARALSAAALSVVDLRPLIEVAGELGPQVFEQVKDLAPGALSAPIHDAFDWVVVEVTAREAARPLAAAEAAPEVRAAIRAERRRAGLAARATELLAGFELTDAGRQWVAEGVR